MLLVECCHGTQPRTDTPCIVAGRGARSRSTSPPGGAAPARAQAAGSVRFAMVDGPGDGPTGSGFEPMPFAMLGGFTSYRIGVESMEVVFHAHNGTVLYTTPKIMPRNLTELRLNSQ